MKIRVAGTFTLIVLILVACGIMDSQKPQSSESAATTDAPKVDVDNELGILLAGFKLPDCDDSREGKVIYEAETKIFKHCSEKEWSALEMKGAQGDKGDVGVTGLSSLVKKAVEAAGDNCTDGGVKFQAGLDKNSDGLLGDDEVGVESYLCSIKGEKGEAGAAGASGHSTLMSMKTEAAGANCAAGGTKITSGIDDGANSSTQNDDILSEGEILSTSYICNGTTGATGSVGSTGATGNTGATGSSGFNSLIRIINESAGVNCTAGGRKIESGLDDALPTGSANDGTLQAGEVDVTTFVCNGVNGSTGSTGSTGATGNAGADGFNSLVKITNEAAGINCSMGGKKVETGLDNGASSGTARNSVLEAGEVSATQYVCNGFDGSHIGQRLFQSDGTLVGQIIDVMSRFEQPSGGISALQHKMLLVSNGTYSAIYYQTAFSGTYSTTSGSSSTSTYTIQAEKPSGTLTRQGLPKDGLVYTTQNCSGTAYVPASTSGGQRNCVGFGCAYDFANSAWFSLFASKGLLYSKSSSLDALVTADCTSPSTMNLNSISNFDGTSCQLYCRNNSYSACSNDPLPVLSAQVCAFTTMSKQFVDSIATGWYIAP